MNATVTEDIAAALELVRARAAVLRERVATLDGEQTELQTERERIRSLPIPYRERVDRALEAIDGAAEAYKVDLEHSIRNAELVRLWAEPFHFALLRPQSAALEREDASRMFEFLAWADGDRLKKKLGAVFASLEPKGDQAGLAMPERVAKVKEIDARLAAIGAEYEQIRTELAHLTP